MPRLSINGTRINGSPKLPAPAKQDAENRPESELSDLNVAIIDYGSFISLADMMGRVTNFTGYYSPYEQEYLGVDRCVIGEGFQTFKRLDDFFSPEIFDEIDLFMFPDIGYAGLQRYLRKRGKLVWGSMGATELELSRTQFVKVVKEAGLPVVHSEVITGLTALAAHLRKVKDKWIKINRYRENMETWYHKDFTHSERELERLTKIFGPLKDQQVFVVQDAIEEEGGQPVIEIGYDGWMVTAPDGTPQFPPSSFQGFEKKNELYLGSMLAAKDLPKEVKLVNEKFAPVLAKQGYRNFWATEIRVKNKVPYFIDPTARMAGQTMEHALETCTNLPEVIFSGAQGKIVAPKFSADYAAEATLHYKSNGNHMDWKTIVLPKGSERSFKLYHCCQANGAYHFPPHRSDELGVVIGNGDTIEKAIENLSENFAVAKDEPMFIETAGFADLIKEIKKAQAEGVKFTDKAVPKPEIVMDIDT